MFLRNSSPPSPKYAADKGGELGASGSQESMVPRWEYLSRVTGNVDTFALLFDRQGKPTSELVDIISELPIQSEATSLGQALLDPEKFPHPAVEELLQKTFFRPNEAQFSFETAAQGQPPSEQQLEMFRKLGWVEPLSVPREASYDVGVVFGGLLGAIDSRTRYLLRHKEQISSIALLGGKRGIIEEREGGDKLEAVIGSEYYNELVQSGTLPKTEFELMRCVWESLCRRDESLRGIPVIEINSELRIGNVKEAPGTPDTVVDLANTLTSGYRVPGLDSMPTSFLLSSSQPYAVRQREDFLAAMAVLTYPNLTEVSVVGYEAESIPSLKLYATELAKMVHAQYLARYSWRPPS